MDTMPNEAQAHTQRPMPNAHSTSKTHIRDIISRNV